MPQNLDEITDPEAFAIYAALVPKAWANQSKDPLLLQQEKKTTSPGSLSPAAVADPEWLEVVNSFKQENTRPKVLRATLPISGPYRLIPRPEIEADDARLALKYPGIYNADLSRWSMRLCQRSASVRTR